MKKSIFRIIVIVLILSLSFPAAVFAREEEPQASVSSDVSADSISQSSDPAGETAQPSSTPSSSAQASPSSDPSPSVSVAPQIGLTEEMIAQIKALAAIDGASAAAQLNAYSTDASFISAAIEILDSYLSSADAMQYEAFCSAIDLNKAGLSAEISGLKALPASAFEGKLEQGTDGNYHFTYPGQLSSQAENAFCSMFSNGEQYAQTAFSVLLPQGAASADLYGYLIKPQASNVYDRAQFTPQKESGQSNIYEYIAEFTSGGLQAIQPPSQAARVYIIAFRDTNGNILSLEKVVYSVSASAQTNLQVQESTAENLPYVDGQVLVVFKDNVSESQEANVIANFGSEETDANEISVVDISQGNTVEQTVSELNQDPNVLVAQPNYIYTLLEEDAALEPMTTVVNDPYYSNQWYLNYIGMREAWDYSKTQNTIKVAILDTGIDLTHPDLQNNIVYSWDVDTNSALTGDLGSHGTHVAGIIAAQANNGVGTAGVSYNASIIAINVFSHSTGYTDSYNLCQGYDLAVSQGARVINMSLGGYFGTDSEGYYDLLLESKIDAAASIGIVTVCAGGNGDDYGNPITDPMFPGDYETCISVVPLDYLSDQRASYADYNAYKDISAPGNYIYSTIPGSYGYKSGSSMATPVISGVIAAMIAAHPALTVAQIKNILYSTATDLNTPGRDDLYGYGKVNALKAVQCAADQTAPAMDSVTTSTNPSTTAAFTATAQNVTDNITGVASVRFAVWSATGGQDDLKWYTAANDGSGNWTAAMSALYHNNDVGTYYIHAYGTDVAGNTGYMGFTTITLDHRDVTPPTLASITKSASPCTTASFYVSARGVADAKSVVSSVRFAVWSATGGQDDLRWYSAASDGAGNWTATMNAANHKNDVGMYYIHIYGTDSAGNTGFMGFTTVTMDHRDAAAPTMASISGSASPCTTADFYMTAVGVTDDKSGVASVRFAVWSAVGGQDDLRWYTGRKTDTNNWSFNTSALLHNNDTGVYYIHAFGTDNAGNTGFMGYTSITLDHKDTAGPVMASITGSASPCTTPDFYFTAVGVTDDKSGVASVRFAVWSATNGQDDLRWYTGRKTAANNWSFNTSTILHNNNKGIYYIHVYGTDNASNTSFLGWTSLLLQ